MDNRLLQALTTSKTYVVAVSGGVDSVVLLDLVAQMFKDSKANIIVAHFDHGIRDDSVNDAHFVSDKAQQYGFLYESGLGALGATANEAQARNARYNFLEAVREKYHATALVLAHHQDDVLETICMNLIRGTGRKGLSSLASNENRIRPFIGITKKEIITYARLNNLTWREDETNSDTRYFRNYVRQYITPRFTTANRNRMLEIYSRSLERNSKIDQLTGRIINDIATREDRGLSIPREYFLIVHKTVALETLAYILRSESNSVEISSRLLKDLWLATKVLLPGKRFVVGKNFELHISYDRVLFCAAS